MENNSKELFWDGKGNEINYILEVDLKDFLGLSPTLSSKGRAGNHLLKL
jgi:hypothetical protein